MKLARIDTAVLIDELRSRGVHVDEPESEPAPEPEPEPEGMPIQPVLKAGPSGLMDGVPESERQRFLRWLRT